MFKYYYRVLLVFIFSLLLLGIPEAHAVPAFARETGMECSACHVGSFGPQLTSVGRNFKLHAYMFGDATQTLSDYMKGFSAMAFGGIEHSNGNLRNNIELSGNQTRFTSNDNVTLDQLSLFYGGRLFSNVGMLAQVTYSNPNQQTAWDNTDIRYANTGELGGKSLIYGVTLNNNPSAQDIWQSTPAWMFPYASSALLQTPTAAPYISSLGGTVGGVGIYGMWNDLLYAEITGYSTLPDKTQNSLGEGDIAGSDHLHGLAPYWRVALQHDFGPHYVEVGTYGLAADRYPGNLRGLGTDHFLDYAVDATYQMTSGNGKHAVSIYGSLLREQANLDASFASGASANPSDHLTNLRANVSYYYNNTYGLTFGPFNTTGSADSVLYANPTTSKPDSAGWVMQADYTPFGTASAVAYPNLNMRLFAQYTAYTKFNGLSNNYDGSGRNASDNNMFYTGVWLTF